MITLCMLKLQSQNLHRFRKLSTFLFLRNAGVFRSVTNAAIASYKIAQYFLNCFTSNINRYTADILLYVTSN